MKGVNSIDSLLKNSKDLNDDDINLFIYLLCEDDAIFLSFVRGYIDLNDLEHYVGKYYIFHRYNEIKDKYDFKV